jgi:hypothetical protein
VSENDGTPDESTEATPAPLETTPETEVSEVGAEAADAPVPEVPTTPEVPDAPSTPPVTPAPDVPEVPDVPDVPEVPEVPDVPEVPEVPDVPDVPDVPPTPDVPAVPEVPATPDVPESPTAGPTPDATVPASAPTPRPLPRPIPKPTALRPPAAPADRGPTPAHVPAVIAPPALTAEESAEAARWGRVDEDGTVWVRDSSGERVVGQYPGADTADALAFYVRRYADLHAKVALFESRLTATDLAVKEIDSTVKSLTEELAEPAAVGDLDALRARLETIKGVAAERRAVADAERAAAKKAALEARTAIVEAAEKIAATDPEKIQWRPAGEELRLLLDQWKDAQRNGPRVDRGAEDALWKRFSHARSTFDRERRRYFSELEKQNASAKNEKATLVAEAEKLATSTDWGATSAAFRELMTRWKSAGRASRKDDDALWARFRAAQDQFFLARDADQKQTEAEFSANLEVKLALLEEAEKLVPVRDLPAAKAALRSVQERWETAGKVPRADVQRVEARLRAVEQAVRDADQSQWQRTNPETRARAEGAAAQLLSAIAGLEADLAKAQAAGDQRRIKEATAALEARRAWLEQVERAAAESRG